MHMLLLHPRIQGIRYHTQVMAPEIACTCILISVNLYRWTLTTLTLIVVACSKDVHLHNALSRRFHMLRWC